MKITDTPIGGVQLVLQPFMHDARGGFARLFCDSELQGLLRGRRIAQVNASVTHEVGTVRGMHFQHSPHGETKFVRCLRGRVMDVALDLRRGSPTFLRWHAEELAAHDGRMLVLPEGVAHGFQVLMPDSELLYLHTAAYAPQAEGGVRCDDPRVGIRWPLPVRGLSERDRSHPLIGDSFDGVDA
jgi:dTDP-4-dehydrorhamnose 3,5-epimerase